MKFMGLLLLIISENVFAMGYRPEHIAADSAWLVEIQQRMEKVDTMFSASGWAYYTRCIYGSRLDKARKEWNIIIYHDYNITRLDRIQGLFDNPVLNRAAKLTYVKYLELWCELGFDTWGIYKRLNDLFINYRPDFEGEKRTDRYLEYIYCSDPDRERRKRAWTSRVSVGKKISGGLIELVRERNRLAYKRDFDQYYEFRINMLGLTTDRVYVLLDKLNLATRDAYLKIYLKRKENLQVEKLELWDLTYDPETVYMGDSYSEEDLLPTLFGTFQGMGFDTEKFGITFDLEPRDGKLQNGLCMPVSVPNDIRVMASLDRGRESYLTLFHEYGHAIHFANIDQDHYILRNSTDYILCEAMAAFGRGIISEPEWFIKYQNIPEKDIPQILDKLIEQKIIELRRMLAYVYFEIELYRTDAENPDGLFWDVMERILFCGRNDGSDAWASIYHFTAAPVYCQNYIFGELIAAQIMHYMRNLNGYIIDNPGGAEYLIEKYYKSGALYDWYELIEKATGENLNTKYYLSESLDIQRDTENAVSGEETQSK